MSLNLAWLQSDGTMAVTTLELDRDQPTLREARLAFSAALQAHNANAIDAFGKYNNFEKLVALPLQAGIPMERLQADWDRERLQLKATAQDLETRLDLPLDMELYSNLLEVHLVALDLETPLISRASAGAPRNDVDTRYWRQHRPPTSPQALPEAGPSSRAPASGCARCAARGVQVQHEQPSACPSAPLCSICQQRGHFTGQCGPSYSLSLPQAKRRRREVVVSPPAPPSLPHFELAAAATTTTTTTTTPFEPIASTSQTPDLDHLSHALLPSKRKRNDSSDWDYPPDTQTSSLSPTMTVASAATGLSTTGSANSSLSAAQDQDASAALGPQTHADTSILEDDDDEDRAYNYKVRRRKTRVQKVAEAKLRKARLKERMKESNPHRLVELRPAMVFPKIATDGHDGQIGLYDGVLVWAKMQDHPWWPAEVMCFEEGGIVPINVKDITVLFFEEDGQRTQGVVLRKTLLQLGTNDEFDELMLNSQKQVTTCRGREARAVQQGLYKAYEWARAAEADDSDDSSVSQ